MPVTLKDIAERAGVSFQTVSVVLNCRQSSMHVKAETRERVERIAREMGYERDAMASALARGKVEAVGIAAYGLNDPHIAAALERAESLCAANGHAMVVAAAGGHEQWLPLLRRRRVDALLTIGVQAAFRSEGDIDEAYRAKVAIVGPYYASPGAAGARCFKACWSDADLGAKAVRHLLSLGHRKLAILSGNVDVDTPLNDKVAGAVAAAREAGAEHRLFRRPDAADVFADADAMAEEFLASGFDASALLLRNDTLFAGTLFALQRHGVKVPDDLSVMACIGMGERVSCVYTRLPDTVAMVLGHYFQRGAFPAQDIPVDPVVRPGQTAIPHSGA